MVTIKHLIFASAFMLLSFFSIAQNKYALIIGINDYYEQKGIKSSESLNGAVNDANAIRQLLVSKFGFKTNNIDTIYNAIATRDNIIEGLKRKLKQCKPGDAMVFYFSGHGVWMVNSQLKGDTVKRGMSQAMLTSDLYSYRDHFKCFLRDVTLKTYFNYFVDKKIILTTIFDCCYSANLMMADPESKSIAVRTKAVDFNELMGSLTSQEENSQQLIDSITGIKITEPAGCPTNREGRITDTPDSDFDGVPDCRDKEKLTAQECLPVNADGIGRCSFDALLQKTLNEFDAAELKKNDGAEPNPIVSRNFNAREVLNISERDTVARPSERKNSKFLSLSATTDYQKALEFKDKNNIMHGLFTASLIRVYSKNPVNISVADLFQQINADMAGFKLDQKPTTH